MFYANVANPGQKRTIRPLFAHTQATPWPVFLDPDWDRSFDIYPGTVMSKKGDELVVPYTAASGQKPWGLSNFFLSSVLGIDEISNTGTNNFTVWVGGGGDNEFEILAPAFDLTGDWTIATDGSNQLLTATNHGLLTPTGATVANAIAKLSSVPSTDKIRVTLISSIAAS